MVEPPQPAAGCNQASADALVVAQQTEWILLREALADRGLWWSPFS
jgi:ABC-type enterochelin transport system ATPase subunit